MPTPRFLSAHRYGLGLALVLLLHGCVNYVWIDRDRTLRGQDMGTQIAAHSLARRLVVDHGPSGVAMAARGKGPGVWPTASSLPWVAMSLTMGQSLPSLRMYNLLWLALLLGAVFYTGRLMGSRSGGMLAAALLSLYPAVYGASRMFGADLPATAVIALILALLLRSRRFHRPGASILFGVALGWGVLMRPHSLFWTVPPTLLLVAAGVSRPAGLSPWRVLAHASGAAACSLLVSSIWWGGRLRKAMDGFITHQTDSGEGGSLGILLPNLAHYGRILSDLATPFQLCLLALGLAALVARGRRRPRGAAPEAAPVGWPEWGALISWPAGGLLAHSLIQVTSPRYMLPALPAMALVTGLGLAAVAWRGPRRTIAGISLMACAALWLLCSFHPSRPTEFVDHAPPLGSPFACCGPGQYGGPPSVDGAYLVAGDVTRIIGKRHPRGVGVMLKVAPFSGLEVHPLVVLRARVLTELPKSLSSSLSWPQMNGDRSLFDSWHVTLGGESFHRPMGTFRHCFTVSIRARRDDGMARPEEHVLARPAKLLYRRVFTSRVESYDIALYAHPACPG